MQGRNALKIVWDDGPNASYDSTAYKATLEEAARKPGPVVRNDGGLLPRRRPAAAKRITAEYYIPHLAHASMEPPAASARITQGKCEGMGLLPSRPRPRADLVAKRTGYAGRECHGVRHVCSAGGFGRKSKPDYGIEAAVLSKAMDGKPVKVVWTRRRRSAQRLLSYRGPSNISKPASTHREKTGRMAASHRRADDHFHLRRGRQAGGELGAGEWASLTFPSPFPTFASRIRKAIAHTRIGWFRSVSNIPPCVSAVQSFVAELAAAAGRDQKDYSARSYRARTGRLAANAERYVEPMANRPSATPWTPARLRAVAELAATQGNWGRSLPKGRGLGIAAHYSFVSYGRGGRGKSWSTPKGAS